MNDTASLARRLEELAAKATPGPWWYQHDEYSDPDYADPPAENPLGVIRAGDNKRGIFVTHTDLEGSGSIKPDDAALIAELVNNLPTIIAALASQPEGWQVPEGEYAELVERLLREAAFSEEMGPDNTDAVAMREAATALQRLTAERDEARAESEANCEMVYSMSRKLTSAESRSKELEKALLRARTYGVQSRMFHAFESYELAQWIDGGMTGSLPEVRSPSVRAVLTKEEAGNA